MQGGEWKGRRRPTRFRRFRRGRLALIAVFAALFIFGLVKLIGYGADYVSAQRTAETLRQLSRPEASAAPAETAAPSAVPSAAPSPALPKAAPGPTAAPAVRLENADYPFNSTLKISDRFRILRGKNKEIVGWLTIGNLLDEAVVQRDEMYYMTHDALGAPNVNGAIFLDSGVSLKTRPYTFVLYGHNLKTGAMFGSLRNYEKVSFYHSNPFITFDTLYETGRYVIFAAGSVSTEKYGRHYVDFFALTGMNIPDRQTAIDALKAASVHTCMVDVQPEDQLLLLVTCVEKDEDRRVVAARRIRDGEDEKKLKELVERSRKR